MIGYITALSKLGLGWKITLTEPWILLPEGTEGLRARKKKLVQLRSA